MSQSESSFKFHQDLIPGIENALAQHKIFVRKARDRSQKMLFFFGLCLKTEDQIANAATDQYRDFSRSQIMQLTFRPERHASFVHDMMDQLAARVDKNWANSKQNVFKEGQAGKPNEKTPIWGKEGVALGGIGLSDIAQSWR